MPESLDLQQAERKAFTLTFQDGLLDLALGLELVALVVAPLLERTRPLADWWIALLSLPILVALAAGKRLLTTPRLGRVRFLPARKVRMQAVATILGIIVLGGLLVGMAWFWLGQEHLPEWVGEMLSPTILWAAISLFLFSLAAHTLGLPRLYLYGAMYALVHPAQALLRTRPDLGALPLVPNLISAAVMLAIGGLLLTRFLRAYPPLAGEDFYGHG